MRDKTNNEKGIAMIMVVIAMVVIIGFAALAVDFGNAATRKSRLQNACDAAALAGAQALTDKDEAEDIAVAIFNKNIQNNINNASMGEPEISFAEDNQKIIVSAHEEFDTYFAGIFGMHKMGVNTDAAAVKGPLAKAGEGLRPFGIDIETWNNYEDLMDEDTLDVVLELGPGDGTQGNYQLIDLDSSGKDGVNENIIYGSDTSYSIDEIIYTETGVAVGPVKSAVEEITDVTSEHYPDYLNDDLDGYIICPILQPLDANDLPMAWEDMTGKWKTKIVGFAVVEIDSYEVSDKSVTGRIVNKFDAITVAGEVDLDADDFGIYAINLVD